MFLYESVGDTIPYRHGYTTREKLNKAIERVIKEYSTEEEGFRLIEKSDTSLIFEYDGYYGKVVRRYRITEIHLD